MVRQSIGSKSMDLRKSIYPNLTSKVSSRDVYYPRRHKKKNKQYPTNVANQQVQRNKDCANFEFTRFLFFFGFCSHLIGSNCSFPLIHCATLTLNFYIEEINQPLFLSSIQHKLCYSLFLQEKKVYNIIVKVEIKRGIKD